MAWPLMLGKGVLPMRSCLLHGGGSFDTLKIHQQIYGTTKGALAGLGGQGGASFSIRRLFRGIGAPLVTTGFVQTLNFGIYDNVLRSLAVNHEARLQDYFVAGSVSGSCISIITCPVSLIKIQLQVGGRSSGDSPDCPPSLLPVAGCRTDECGLLLHVLLGRQHPAWAW